MVKDRIFRFIVFVLLAWLIYDATFIYDTIVERYRKGYTSPHLSDLWTSLGFALLFGVVESFFRRSLMPLAKAYITKKPTWSMQVYAAKTDRCCVALYRFFFNIMISGWAYSLLAETPYLPKAILGSGDTKHFWTDGFPYQTLDEDLKWFYLVFVGDHLASIFLQIWFERGRPDYHELLLHHICTATLVSLSYVMNYLRIGSVVLYIHALSDIFVHLSKILVDTSFKKLTLGSYVLLLLTYCYTRLYVYPLIILKSSWLESRAIARESGISIPSWGFLNFMLWLLFLLHVYWFSLVIRIGVLLIRTGRVSDIQANLSSMSLNQEVNKKTR